eukprot:c32584_g1_i1.p1 GENE.c32584_g1_i1~~c32584_g1_i1.p1  ORF type:complete len:335 (+),score=71.48 c32584_g1_i1:55-1005(+)
MEQIGPAMEATSIAIIDAVRYGGVVLTDAGVTSVVDSLRAQTVDVVSKYAPQVLTFGNWLYSEPHPYVKTLNLPLMDPFLVLLIIVGYVVLIQVLKLVMSGCNKFTLKWYSLVHNAFLVVLSAFMCAETIRNVINLKYGLFGNYSQFSPAEHALARIVWIFYISKIPEMGDTVIMALKKNNHQISFLHQYHHVSIFFIWSLVTTSYPCGEAYFSIVLNSFVHVLMYGYYFGATFGWQPWWKRYLTYFQMAQFMSNMVQAAYDIWFLRVDPSWLMQVLFWYMITLLILFANYLRQQSNQARAAKKSSGATTPTKKKQ